MEENTVIYSEDIVAFAKKYKACWDNERLPKVQYLQNFSSKNILGGDNMPVYEYQCKNCGKVSEFLIGVVQENIEIKCKYCGSKELNKIFFKSFVSRGGNLIPYQGGKTCCGRDERCKVPPCSDGTCVR